jgi:hypothetical protein
VPPHASFTVARDTDGGQVGIRVGYGHAFGAGSLADGTIDRPGKQCNVRREILREPPIADMRDGRAISGKQAS